MKLLKRITAMFCFMALFMALTCPNTASAGPTKFTAAEESKLVTKSDPVEFTYGKGEVRFYMAQDGSLVLSDKATGKQLMDFHHIGNPSPQDRDHLFYLIFKINAKSPKMELFEIKALTGNRGRNVGYWIIREDKNGWNVLMDVDGLSVAGYDPFTWHLLRTAVNPGKSGQWILVAERGYLPYGTTDPDRLKTEQDMRVQLVWDRNAGWFELYPF